MTKNLIILGSTGSIGETTLNIVRRNKKNFRIILLSTNSNIKKIYEQANEFNVRSVVINDQKKLIRFEKQFKKKKIKVFTNIEQALKKKNKKAYFTVSAVSGLDGLESTIQVIKHTQKIGIANKESIICGWNFIQKELKKYKTNFIPLDSEHFSIWTLLSNENLDNVKKIYLTASGGPFLNKTLKDIKNVSPKVALKHPNWKMGKKISIDSATMMNKVFEVIEAKKIFNLNINKFEILIHPKSYIHAIIHFNTGLIKFLAHDTTMEIPIINCLHDKSEKIIYDNNDFEFLKLNGLNFIKPNDKNFPLIKLLNYKFNNTFLEIILVTMNDALVKYYLEDKISYISLHKTLLMLMKRPYFKKFYNVTPNNINEINNMIKVVKKYLVKHLKVR